MNTLKKVSQQHHNEFLFIVSKGNEDNAVALMRILGVKEEQFPVVRIVETNKAKKSIQKYKPLTEEVTFQNIKNTLVKFLQKEIGEYFKAEKVPSYQHPLVKKVVRDNFQEIVMDPTKNVIIAFKTDWCEHCKEIDKCFEDVKKELHKDVKDFVFATVNYDDNDLNLEIT